jgi:DNA-binding CsgD family transcriptional regulator
MAERVDTAENVPIPKTHVTSVAARNLVDEGDLAEALASIHEQMVDGADAIHEHYRSEDNPEPVAVAGGLATVVFVTGETWERVLAEVPEKLRGPARESHAEFAGEFDVAEASLGQYEPLVMPSQEVGELVRAGLSRRQAEVQVLRNSGLTQREVGERLGMATNTVKVHCHRVDTKVENAKRLLALVGADDD